MKTRSLILLLLIVGIPLSLLIWAAQRIARNEQVVVRQQFSTLMEDRLLDVNRSIQRYFETTEAHLQQLTELDHPDTATLRHLTRTEPRVMQMFLLTPSGDLSYPDPAAVLNSGEKSFLLRAAKMFTEQQFSSVLKQSDSSYGLPGEMQVANQAAKPADRYEQSLDDSIADDLTADTAMSEPSQAGTQQNLETPRNNPESSDSGWFVWYWDRGLNLIFWHRRPSGRIVGVALDRARWMADVIAELPDTVGVSSGSKLRRLSTSSDENVLKVQMKLINAASDVVYQWGSGDDSATETVADIPVVAPLASWRLQAIVRPDDMPGSGRSVAWGLTGGLLATCIAVGMLGFVLFRDYRRDMREASRQVSFVNQVSHELKTPLTNIRLYAELLERDLNGLDSTESEQPKKRLDVILSEGQRLSRLIGNVLTFARQNQNALEPNLAEDVPDDVVRRVLNRFDPSLSALGIQLQSTLNAADRCRLDADFLEQILGNLISNVEKYAADGRTLRVQTRLSGDLLQIDVVDCGPGVPDRDCVRIFEPFVRMTRDISSAAGTGIGLSIARRLARLHGGDVVLKDSRNGCHFQVTLEAKTLR